MDENKFRLPIYRTVVESLSELAKHGLRLLSSLAIIAFITLALRQYQVLEGEHASGWIIESVLMLLQVLIAITVHRVLILGDSSVPIYGFRTFGARALLYLLWTLSISFVVIAPLSLFETIFTGLVDKVDTRPLGIIFVVSSYQVLIVFCILMAAYVISRISVALPAVAIDNEQGVQWAWSVSRRNGIRIAIVTFVIPGIVAFLIEYLVGSSGVYMRLFSNILNLLLLVFSTSVLSISYKYLAYDMRIG